MSASATAARLGAWALNPWVTLLSLAAGVLIGWRLPAISLPLALVGDVYVDLLKMVVLPFMVSAIIFSLQRLFRQGGAGALVLRVLAVFALAGTVTAATGVLTFQALQAGAEVQAITLQRFGQIVGADTRSGDTTMSLYGQDAAPPQGVTVAAVVRSLVPDNLFAALASGQTLKVLVFALLFGLAVGHVPQRDGTLALVHTLETVYQGCQVLMRWFTFPLPLVMLCMSASQTARTGLEPLLAMGSFLGGFTLASVLVLALAVAVVVWRTGLRPGVVLQALREPFFMAVATRSSATCMPAMIEALAERLRFERTRVELMVPLSISLLRLGPVLYYVCATLFVAQLYGRPLSGPDLLLVGAACLLAGLASAGMTGVVTISLTGVVCGYLGLPFEAAFVLFVAVDPLCDMLRTALLVIGNTAAVAAICPHEMVAQPAARPVSPAA
jgi:Na+/H+-dicarboxylate symporter